MEKHTIISKIKAYNTIIVHRHIRPDPDALGSQAGLAEMVKHSFPDKQVFVVGDVDPSLSFLAEMDVVEDKVYEQALVIVCDTANQERIADQRYAKGKEIIKIDHHPNVEPYGSTVWVDTTVSSTSEMIYELFLEAEKSGLVCNGEAARLLYAGIVGDTGRFLFPSTTNKTFHYAAELVTYPFDRTGLYEQLYNTNLPLARLKGYILQNFTVSENGVSSIRLDKAVLTDFKVTALETSQLVGVLGDIEGIKAWAFFVEEEEVIRVRLRSRGPAINGVAARHNGGGHPLAAGATIYKWEETEDVMKDLEAACRSFEQE